MDMIDFRHIHIDSPAGPLDVSLDRVFEAAEKTEFSEAARHLKTEASLRCREVLKGLVPDLDLLEKKLSSEPSKLRIEMLARISDSLLEIEKLNPGATSSIGKSVGLDPDLFPKPDAYVAALSQFIFEKLYPPVDLASALNVVTAGDLVKDLTRFGRVSLSLSKKLKVLFEEISSLLAALIVDSRPFLPPLGAPKTPPSGPVFIQHQIAVLSGNRADDQYGLRLEDRKPSTVDTISKACNDLGLAAQQRNRAEMAESEEEHELKVCNDKKELMHFLGAHPHLKKALLERLGDRNFTDGPLTLIQKLIALDKVMEDLQMDS